MSRVTILHVTDCPNAAVLQQRLAHVLADRADVQVELRLIDSDQGATESGMTGSPTLLVDGVDPFAVTEQAPSLSCRLYVDDGGAITGAPSLTQLYRAFAPNSALAQTVETDSASVDESDCCTPTQLTGPSRRLTDWRARSAPRDRAQHAGPSSAGVFGMVGVAVLAVLCCAGPALLAGGALSGSGGALGNGWLITIGAGLVVGALGYGTVRLLRAAGPPRAGDCRPVGVSTELEPRCSSQFLGTDISVTSEPNRRSR